MKSWKIAVPSFAGGLIVGATSLYLLLPDWELQKSLSELNRAEASHPEPATASESALLARIDEQKLEIDRLNDALRQAPEEPAPPSPEEAQPPPQDTRRNGFNRRIEGFTTRRAGELAQSLGLNDEQKAQLQKVFQDQFVNMRARRRGEEVEAFNLDDALSQVLTPEQFDAYLQSTQEEIYNRAELMATSQMVRMNQIIGLSQDQMDKVYDAFNITTQEMLISRQTGESYDMGQNLRDRLSSVLTAEQMQQYLDQMSGGRPGMGPGMLGP